MTTQSRDIFTSFSIEVIEPDQKIYIIPTVFDIFFAWIRFLLVEKFISFEYRLLYHALLELVKQLIKIYKKKISSFFFQVWTWIIKNNMELQHN